MKDNENQFEDMQKQLEDLNVSLAEANKKVEDFLNLKNLILLNEIFLGLQYYFLKEKDFLTLGNLL